MANTIEPVPYKVPMTDGNGYVAMPWSKFLQSLLVRVGGPVASTNTELQATVSGADLTALTAQVVALQLIVSSLNTQTNDLNQGPVL